jgi:hypothetical protein
VASHAKNRLLELVSAKNPEQGLIRSINISTESEDEIHNEKTLGSSPNGEVIDYWPWLFALLGWLKRRKAADTCRRLIE